MRVGFYIVGAQFFFFSRFGSLIWLVRIMRGIFVLHKADSKFGLFLNKYLGILRQYF